MKIFGGGRPEHAMADRKETARILAELPAQDLKALEELAHWHETLAAAQGFKPEERAHRLAAVDEAAQPRLRKLGREYIALARTQKASRAQENLMWLRIHEYWNQAGQAYAKAIDEPKSGPELVAGAARSLTQQLKWQHLRYGPIDAPVWGLANRVFAAAEARNVAEARTEFLRIAFLSASSPDSLLIAELELAERLIGDLCGAFVVAKSGAPELPYWIDLGQPMAPARVAKPPQATPGLRFLGPGPALAKVRGWIESIQAKRAVPSELKLGADADAEMVLGVLNHLAMYWAPEAPERKHKRHSMASSLKIVHGFDGIVEALGGGAASLDFGGGPAGESWKVENVSAGGFGALAPQAKSEWLKVGALIAAKPDNTGSWMIGAVRRVNKISAQEVRVGVETLSRAPAVSQFALRNATQAQGVLLPAAVPGSADASIALKAGIYPPGENLEARVGERHHVYMPQGVAERGDDYEIVKFKAMVRES